MRCLPGVEEGASRSALTAFTPGLSDQQPNHQLNPKGHSENHISQTILKPVPGESEGSNEELCTDHQWKSRISKK